LRRALHAAHLENVLVSSDRFYHRPPFMNAVRHRLLAIDILTRVRRGDRDDCMPMLWCSDDNSVNVFAAKQLLKIVISRATVVCAGFHLSAVIGFHCLFGIFAPSGVDIANSDDTRVAATNESMHE